MSTHKALDRICAAATLLCLVLTLVLYGAHAAAPVAGPSPIGYEDRLFDTDRVHTIDIVMDNWDEFLTTCENEEYAACSVVIDGEDSRNIGIRAKGNTSLRNVASMGSSRYSFKLEFDHYEAGKSYHGLDKLSLNNLIQDNTCMKDYLSYRLMDVFGVDSPLCSFAWITVNGEDWGLYLAVEGVEDSFLQRRYGGVSGELYKPDSMDMGGGRGNGHAFAFETDGEGETPTPPDGMRFGEGDAPTLPDGADFSGGNMPAPPDGLSFGEGDAPALPDGMSFGEGDAPALPDGMNFGQGFGGGGMGTDDVRLQYIDDDPASYPNLFDNAKTAVTDADKTRLIASLKALSACEDLENVLDIDEILRYFVVHNFVVNGDSYTGSMIHNYYLYEQAGRLSMIPWDYNLAFGTFTGGAASSAVNSAIDDVLSDRPMQAWIFSDDTYTRQYHALYAEFLESVDTDALIEQAAALITPYVEKDPTAFCTCEEFLAGTQALKTFCRLRAQSVRGQLAGSIPATSEAQRADQSALVSAEGLELSALGTMQSGGGMPAFGGESAAGTQTDASGNTQAPDAGGQENAPVAPDTQVQSDRRGGARPGAFPAAPVEAQASALSGPVLLAVCLLVLLGGLVFAFLFRK